MKKNRSFKGSLLLAWPLEAGAAHTSSAPTVGLDPSSLPGQFGFDGVAGAQVMGGEKLSLTGLDRAGNRT